MNVFKIVFLTVCMFGVSTRGARLVRAEEPLDVKLQELDRLRSGLSTPFDEVERRAEVLLKEHPAAEDQAKTYYQLAHTYAQGGIGLPENAKRVVEYSKKAMEYPLDPIRKLRLYNYLGDGIMLADRSRALAERRREAAMVYLNGLKEAQKYNIPDERPKQPPLTPPPWDEEERKKWHERYMAARRQWDYECDMFQRRRVLVNQLVYVYAQKPHAGTELAELATKILDDADIVALLTSRLEERGALKDD